MTGTFRLNVFGAPELSNGDGKPIRLRTRKQLALLVYLVLEARDRPVSRERLLDLMWPGVRPKLARHSLSQAFTAIRAHLGADAIASSADDPRLRAQVRTDLDELAPGRGATEVPADPLLGLDLTGGLAFSHHWVDGAPKSSRPRVTHCSTISRSCAPAAKSGGSMSRRPSSLGAGSAVRAFVRAVDDLADHL